jgi:hypothetical protein
VKLPFGGVVEAFRTNRRLWAAYRAPLTAVRDGKPGETIKIAGRIEVYGETLESPFTRTRCVAYDAAFDKKALLDKSHFELLESDKWYFQRQLELTRRVPFWLVDEAGDRVLVADDPGMSRFGMVSVDEHPHVNEEHPAVAVLLRGHGIMMTRFMGIDGDHRFWEAPLVPDAHVAVLGTLEETADVVTAGYRDASRTRRTLRGTAHDPLVLVRA